MFQIPTGSLPCAFCYSIRNALCVQQSAHRAISGRMNSMSRISPMSRAGMLRFALLLTLSICSTVWAYSAGAPESVCLDMTPKHPVDPQKSKLPYKISVSKNEVKAGESVDIIIGGDKIFKGFLLEVRDGEEAVGSFVVSDSDKYTRTINCSDNKASAVTHKNATDKKNLKITWKAPKAGKYTVYATVAEDGGVFWVRKPTEVITVF